MANFAGYVADNSGYVIYGQGSVCLDPHLQALLANRAPIIFGASGHALLAHNGRMQDTTGISRVG